MATEDSTPTPPSSLDLPRAARAADSRRSTRGGEQNDRDETLVGSDRDADRTAATFVGDEVPGGDNPTPDQSVVDELGRAAGTEYNDAEELRGVDKIAARDRRRWELDPASSEDYNER